MVDFLTELRDFNPEFYAFLVHNIIVHLGTGKHIIADIADIAAIEATPVVSREYLSAHIGTKVGDALNDALTVPRFPQPNVKPEWVLFPTCLTYMALCTCTHTHSPSI